MIQVTCEQCGKNLEAQESQAGTTLKCVNCGTDVTVPLPDAAPEPVVVQIQQQAAPGTVGPRKVGMLPIIFWGLFWPGAQYQWLRQWGKMWTFILITLMLEGLALITCGLGLMLYVPYSIVLLIDGVVLRGKIQRKPIGRWRFF